MTAPEGVRLTARLEFVPPTHVPLTVPEDEIPPALMEAVWPEGDGEADSLPPTQLTEEGIDLLPPPRDE